ncbi:FAD binding domain-containing protein [Legionella drancourtii]|uniref:Putative monooxygenase n=1 Tax=Legionella drancourtii LLAP12 TaxID=658187 RepID=G9ENQ6_9GAMM|nr:NAD(P)-binding protein [Legionella drancourtii]EHL31079.1 putative monooxygenase [Legionella drancourtii LLAP12]
MSRPKIAVVGSAIAGSSMAILLQRANIDVTVYEQRPKGVLVDRGAGIALPKYLVKKLIEMDILDKSFPIIDVNEREFIQFSPKTGEENNLGKKPFLASAVHWGSLYSNLAKRIPDSIIHYDTKVTSLRCEEKVYLTLNNDENEQEYDIVIWADGYHSLGRKYLFPESEPQFTNYIAWRGTLVRVDAETDKHLTNKVPFYLYDKGHLLLYAIPQLTATDTSKEYIVNWLIYENMSPENPIVRDKRFHENVMSNNMTAEYKDYLYRLVKKYFNSFVQEVVLATPEPFTQAIYDAYVPSYFVKNMALAGDASILARPHVGAGSAKAIEDALSLFEQLQMDKDIYSAFTQWSVERQKAGNKLLNLCRDLGGLFVNKMPVWEKSTSSELDKYWEKTVKDHDDWYQINHKRLLKMKE